MIVGLLGIAAVAMVGGIQMARDRQRVVERFSVGHVDAPPRPDTHRWAVRRSPARTDIRLWPFRRITGWWMAGRRDRAVERALPDALDDIAGAARSGSSLAEAIDTAAQAATGGLAEDLAAVHIAVQRGAPLTDALERWAVRRPVPPVRLAVAGLQLAADVGGAQAGALEDLAATVRDRIAVRDDLRAASTQARASAVVLAVAPVGFAAFSGLVDPRTFADTVSRPAGALCLLAGGVLDVAGAWWMLRLSGAGT